jgi:hypothetical protein
MDLTLNSAGNPGEPDLDELITEVKHRLSPEWDSLSANRHIERLYVAAGYVRDYLGCRTRKRIWLSELVILDCYSVAERVAPSLDQDGKAGVARTVRHLVDHARTFHNEMRPVSQN